MRGASALDRVLARFPGAPVRVFIVWEPIILTDVVRPTSHVLSKARDARVAQFWDPGQLVARNMKAAGPGQPEPECCDEEGVWWDLVAVYPHGAQWTNRLPPAAFVNGPVVKMESAVEGQVSRLAPAP